MKRFVKRFCAFLIICTSFIILSTGLSFVVEKSVARYNGITIVLDAGHGGRDGGCVGKNGTIEKEINLEYVQALKNKLVNAGYRVELTRKTDDGLYAEIDSNKKLADMKRRYEIIRRSNPNLMVSIHMNSFQDERVKGASSYYRKDDEASKQCADLIQQSLHKYCDAKLKQSKVGDYYLLNCSYYTSVLVECGYISNSEEEKLLNTEEYKEKVTNAIFNGILLYFGNFSI